MGFDIGAALGGVGMNLVNNAIQYYTQKNQQRQAQSNEQKNMRLQSELEQQGYYNNIVRTPQALRDAGINPAVAAGMSAPSPSVSHSGNSQSVGLQTNGMDIVNGAILNQSQVRLNEAAADKAKAEAKSTEIKNKREETKDSLVSQSTLDVLSAMREETDSPFIRGFIEQFETGVTDKDMNVGLLESFQSVFYDLSQRERDRELDFLVKEFDKQVYQKQFENGSAEAIADMPKATRFQIYRNCALMLAQIGQLNAETSLTEDKRNLIRSNIAKLGQEVESLLHHDPAAMWHSGDISGLLAMVGYDGIKAAASGVGFGVGASLGSRVGGSAAGAFATKSTTPISSMSREQVHKQLQLSRNEIKALKQAKQSAERNKRLGELYQDHKALLDRLRAFSSKGYAR